MLKVERPSDLTAHAGHDLGVTDWVEVTQGKIAEFAALTGDDHWIHVDTERAARELAGGRTIVHGLFLLSLVPALQRQLFQISQRGMGLNYGYDRVRFTAQVSEGARVRLHQRLVSAQQHRLGTQVFLDSTIEVEGSDKPAVAARSILVIADA
ncbi:MAG: MaoC family dehydratase [Alphaproteobacteria bacterium]|nr:MaoC family dehydratase [Alphaproteobacteria bacterium]